MMRMPLRWTALCAVLLLAITPLCVCRVAEVPPLTREHVDSERALDELLPISDTDWLELSDAAVTSALLMAESLASVPRAHPYVDLEIEAPTLRAEHITMLATGDIESSHPSPNPTKRSGRSMHAGVAHANAGLYTTSVDNPGPRTVLPARFVAPITNVGDDAHWVVTLLLGAINSTTSVPDSSSMSIKLLLDLGTADVVLFNKSTCIGSASASPQPADTCSNTIGSSSGFAVSPLGKCGVFAIQADGETLNTNTAVFSETLGVQLLTLGLNLLGTQQMQYLVQPTIMFVTDGSMFAHAAYYLFIDQSDPTTYMIMNQGYYNRADG
jgi:hypothetical protein